MGSQTHDHDIETGVEQLVGASGHLGRIGLRIDLQMGGQGDLRWVSPQVGAVPPENISQPLPLVQLAFDELRVPHRGESGHEP